MTKRIVALVLALVMALSLCGIASAVEADNAAKTLARKVLEQTGVMMGYPDGTFGAGDTLTREQAAKIMCYAALGEAAAERLSASAAPFNDVPLTHWAVKYISYCNNKNIVCGAGDGNFYPGNPVTYDQLMAMTLLMLGYGQNGEFEGAGWTNAVTSVASDIPTLKTAAITSAPAVRGDVANAVYGALFTRKVSMTKDAAGNAAYTPVTTGSLTPAQTLGAEFVSTGTNTVSLKINGVLLTGNYTVNAATGIPDALTPVQEQTAQGELCAVASNSGGKVKLIFADGSSASYETTLDAALTGKFISFDKTAKTATALEGKSGVDDLTKSADTLGGIALTDKTVFLVRTADDSFEQIRKYTGKANVPVIYEAEYAYYKASDGTEYFYIANGQNSPNYTSGGQIFIVDPTDYGNYAGESSQSNYYAAEGAVNGELGTIKFTESYGKTFFATPDSVKPGLYRGVSYEGMRITNIAEGQPANPLYAAFLGDTPSTGMANTPLRGIVYENGEFYIGTNELFRGGRSSLLLKPEDPNLKAFYFNVDSSGNVEASIRRLSEVSDDDEAYVWGTISSGGKLMNLYVVHSEWGKWKELWPLEH